MWNWVTEINLQHCRHKFSSNVKDASQNENTVNSMIARKFEIRIFTDYLKYYCKK